MTTRTRNWLIGLLALLSLRDRRLRTLWAEMRAYVRGLPGLMARPLPDALAAQAPRAADLQVPEAAVRRLADAAALFERRSPVGLCLRRSLLRYHFLGRAGVPLVVHFGARFVNGQPDRTLTGHAWVTRDGKPYYEDGENYRGFTVMLVYPAGEGPRDDAGQGHLGHRSPSA